MIHPRRLGGTPANVARYYTIGDYYTKGGSEPSAWGGRIAAELGLKGAVERGALEELLAGKVGDQHLGRRRHGAIEHHPGWDFSVNAPKSVSIMALVAGDERIVAAHEKAVATAIGWIEEHAALRRRMNGDIVHETTGQLLYARFTEHASRELDPHLHTHVVILNITRHAGDEQMVSLETRAMFAEQMTAGQIYRNELAHRLREIGYDIDFDPRRGLFEIRGVPQDMIADMSRRGEQIDAHAKDHGLEGQAARTRSFFETRRAKQKVGLEDLHSQWSVRSAAHAPTLGAIRSRADERGEREIDVERATASRASLFGLRQSEAGEAVNNLGQLIRTGLASHVGEVRLEDVRPLFEAHEERFKLLRTREQTGDGMLTRGRTSRRTARLEIALSGQISLSLDDTVPLASRERIDAAISGSILNDDQRKVLAWLALSSDRVVSVDGVAGSGKSTLVQQLKSAADPDWTFVGLAPTSSAAGKLGADAGIESRTVAALLAGGGHDIGDRHVLVLDEAGQLGSRQALRVLQISRDTGARIILLGDNKQTGAIEQGKPAWLMQQLGLPTARLMIAVRQETKSMKAAVASARRGDYAASLDALDKVVSGERADKLADLLVGEWTRLKPGTRETTNILVLDNATRLIVNNRIREVLKQEGAIGAEDLRLSILTSSGMTNQEKSFARFYSRGQVVRFARDDAERGIAKNTDYRVDGVEQDSKGRQWVRLAGEEGGQLLWNPRLGRASEVAVFLEDTRDLAAGDRIQWRLAAKALDLKNAERGTVERIDGSVATIRWDRKAEPQAIDLSLHRTWDHGYAETVYSAQSKTYDRAYVLAPLGSGLVNGQNYYTAITRARFGVKLWTEDPERLARKLEANSGEKTSALEALGRLTRDSHRMRSLRHPSAIERERAAMLQTRAERAQLRADRDRMWAEIFRPVSIAERLAGGAHRAAGQLHDYLRGLLSAGKQAAPEPVPEQQRHQEPERGGHDR